MLKEFEEHIESWTLVPSAGGVFDVALDGKVVFSKTGVGRHAAVGEIRDVLRMRLTD